MPVLAWPMRSWPDERDRQRHRLDRERVGDADASASAATISGLDAEVGERAGRVAASEVARGRRLGEVERSVGSRMRLWTRTAFVRRRGGHCCAASLRRRAAPRSREPIGRPTGHPWPSAESPVGAATGPVPAVDRAPGMRQRRPRPCASDRPTTGHLPDHERLRTGRSRAPSDPLACDPAHREARRRPARRARLRRAHRVRPAGRRRRAGAHAGRQGGARPAWPSPSSATSSGCATGCASSASTPTRAMEPFVAALDAFHDRTAPQTWLEGLVKAYVGDGIASDFYREISAVLDAGTRELVARRCSHDTGHADFAVARGAGGDRGRPAGRRPARAVGAPAGRRGAAARPSGSRPTGTP